MSQERKLSRPTFLSSEGANVWLHTALQMSSRLKDRQIDRFSIHNTHSSNLSGILTKTHAIPTTIIPLITPLSSSPLYQTLYKCKTWISQATWWLWPTSIEELKQQTTKTQKTFNTFMVFLSLNTEYTQRYIYPKKTKTNQRCSIMLNDIIIRRIVHTYIQYKHTQYTHSSRPGNKFTCA